MDWHQFKEAASTQQEMAEIERAMAAENQLFTTEEFLSFLERHFNVSNYNFISYNFSINIPLSKRSALDSG